MQIDLNSAGDPAAEPNRRGRPGRPKGLGKVPGSGRQKITGTSQDELRAAIGATPIEFLLEVTLGRKVRVGGPNGARLWRYPSLSERQQAANKLLARVLPELQRSEATLDASVAGNITGLEIEGDSGPSELVRRLAFMLIAARGAREPAAIKHEPAEPITNAAPTGELRAVNGGGRWWVQDLSRTPPRLLAGFETEDEAMRELGRLRGECHA